MRLEEKQNRISRLRVTTPGATRRVVTSRTRCGLIGTASPWGLLPLIERSMPVPGLSLLWVVFQGVQDVFELFGGERSGVADEQCSVRGDDGGERQA